MARAGGVGVGEFVDQRDFRVAGEKAVEVELGEFGAAVKQIFAGDHLQPLEQGFGFHATVSLHDPGHDIGALPPEFTRRLKHGVGFADSCAHSEEDLEFAGGGERVGHESIVSPCGVGMRDSFWHETFLA